LAKNLPTIDRNYKYVLWNHRVASEKRPDLALQIAEALPDGWKLIFSGEPRNESPKVLYAGQIQNPGDWIGVSHVFLSTSDQEGFGYSMAEAITAGVPIVSSPFGIGQDYYPEFVCGLDAPIEKWVEKIVQAYKFPFDEAIHRAEKLIRLHGIECKKLWREIKKPS
jgi:glycosyltransferase involved in cell wall biosynthesis